MIPAAGERTNQPRGARLPRAGWLAVLLLISATFAVIASRPSTTRVVPPTGDVAKAEQAINIALAPGPDRDATGSLPADFTEVIGHPPTTVTAPDGTTRAVHMAGGCSSPWGDDNTRWDFSVGCRAHDLGYDLLRYADAKGQPLGPRLRERLDDRLSADMHAMCDINPRGTPRICHAVAGFYSIGLVVNSWHQRWGPPRNEPIGLWFIGLVVIALLLARMPVLAAGRAIRKHPASPMLAAITIKPAEAAQSGYLDVLRVVSLAGIVLAESVVAITYQGAAQAGWVWPLTWLLQLVPVFFLAGGHANVLAWRAAQAAGGGFGLYLTGRLGWLLRPVLAFVTAWLIVPLSLELFRVPPENITAFNRIVLQPLWLLGLYLLVVAAAPAMLWLHRRIPVATPVGLGGVAATIGLAGRGSVAAHVGGIVAALLFQQFAFHYADGGLWRVRRSILVSVAATAFLGLIMVTTIGGQPKLLIAEPTVYASFAPSLLGTLLIGIVQTCLIALPHERGLRIVAAGARARMVAVIHGAPVTVYLFYLCAMLVVAGVIGAARSAALPADGLTWLAQPRTMLALALIALPAGLSFMLFERRTSLARGVDDEPLQTPGHQPRGGPLDAVAAVLGVGYGALGILGFAAVSITGEAGVPAVLGIPIDPIASLIHLLLGWYLMHSVHVQTTARPWPWLLTAIACAPPLISTGSGANMLVHGATAVLALLLAAWRAERACLPRGGPQPAPETGTR
jgi:hypothetical protein